jgi:hypothetical protein
MTLDTSNEVLRIDETERIGLFGRHNNLVLSPQIGDETIDCLRLGRTFSRVTFGRRRKLATYLYFIGTLATDKQIGQKRSLRASTRRELSFGTNGVLIRRV